MMANTSTAPDSLDLVSRFLSRSAKVEVTLFGRRVSSFQLFGLLGFGASIALGMSLAALRQLSLLVMTGVVAVALITFFVVALATKAFSGSERLVYYHHELAIAASTSAYVASLGQSVLAFLDVTLIALAGLLVFGRVGCFSVGCCHGRPHGFGVTYGPVHVRAGLASRWSGVRLFPIQLFESGIVLVATLVGIGLLASGAPAGQASAWQVACYAVSRFSLEFARGDAERPYYFGLSQAQWISLALLAAVAPHGIAARSAAWAVLPLLASAGAIVAVRLRRSARRPRLIRERGHRLEQLTILPKSRRAPP